MAIQVNFTDAAGVAHTAAYIRVYSFFQLDNAQMEVKAQVYHSAATRSKSDDSQRKEPVRWINYEITGSDFTSWFPEATLDDAGKTTLKQIYGYMKTQATPINLTSGTTDV